MSPPPASGRLSTSPPRGLPPFGRGAVFADNSDQQEVGNVPNTEVPMQRCTGGTKSAAPRSHGRREWANIVLVAQEVLIFLYIFSILFTYFKNRSIEVYIKFIVSLRDSIMYQITSPLIDIVVSVTGISLPAFCNAISTTFSTPEQQGTSMCTVLIDLMLWVLKISLNFSI
jgi:hypothetical protein